MCIDIYRYIHPLSILTPPPPVSLPSPPYRRSDLVAAASTIRHYVKKMVRPRLDAKRQRAAEAAAAADQGPVKSFKHANTFLFGRYTVCNILSYIAVFILFMLFIMVAEAAAAADQGSFKCF